MFFDWLEKVPEFLKFTWLELAKVFIGAFLVGFLALKWVKSIRRATKAQIEAEEHKLAAQLAEREAEYQRKLSEDRGQFHQQIADLQVRLAEEKVDLQKNLIDLQQACRQAEEERDRLQSELAKQQKQWKDLEAFDGKLWQRENTGPTPSFISMADRKVRTVSTPASLSSWLGCSRARPTGTIGNGRNRSAWAPSRSIWRNRLHSRKLAGVIACGLILAKLLQEARIIELGLTPGWQCLCYDQKG